MPIWAGRTGDGDRQFNRSSEWHDPPGALGVFQNGLIVERFGDILFAVESKDRKKRTVLAALALLAMGFPPFVNSLDNPRLAGLRGPDVLQLLAIGLCVGLALGVFFVGFLGGRRSS